MNHAIATAKSKKKPSNFSPSQLLYVAAIATNLIALGGCGPREPESLQNPKTSNQPASTPATASPPVPAKQPDNEIAALQRTIEQVLKCSEAPQPNIIVRSLHHAGVIHFDKSEWTETATYFPILKPIEVWGMKVAYVFGHDNDRKLFSTGPGTAPPTHFGIVVPHSIENVQKRIPTGNTPTDIKLTNVDMNSPQPSTIIFTDIECAQ